MPHVDPSRRTRSRKTLSRQGVDQLYDAWRELALLMAADPDLAALHKHALRDLSSLDEKERARYEQVLIIALDTWEKSIHAEKDGLIAAEAIRPWHDFYRNWVQRRMNCELWDEINRQDWNVCELAQLGAESPAYQPGPYSSLEPMVREFDRHYLEVMAGS